MDYIVIREFMKRCTNDLAPLLQKHKLKIDDLENYIVLDLLEECRDNIGWKQRWIERCDVSLKVQKERKDSKQGQGVEP